MWGIAVLAEAQPDIAWLEEGDPEVNNESQASEARAALAADNERRSFLPKAPPKAKAAAKPGPGKGKAAAKPGFKRSSRS